MATAVKQSADIRKFTGFIAPDGTTHDTLKKATDYTKELKVKAALADFALVTEANSGVTDTDGSGTLVIYVEDLPKFLLAHRAEILASFNQEATTRKPHKPREPKVKTAKVPNAATQAAMIEARNLTDPGFESGEELFESLNAAVTGETGQVDSLTAT